MMIFQIFFFEVGWVEEVDGAEVGADGLDGSDGSEEAEPGEGSMFISVFTFDEFWSIFTPNYM